MVAPIVDFSKPVVFQVGLLGEAYDEWVHQPILTREGPIHYQNKFLEYTTRTPWWAIPLIWLPVSGWLVSHSLNKGLPTHHVVPTMIAGLFVWTLFEYCLHRFIFHLKTTGYWGNTFHYLVHGHHHKHPNDHLRLVFPPLNAAILSTFLWNLVVKPTVPSPHSYALFGGVYIGYVAYDCTHYYLHHAKPITGLANKLKRFHMDHHYKMQELGFGVTTSFWDRVFGTMPPKSTAKIE